MEPADPHMLEREEEKRAALASLADVLTTIRQQQREPDLWERVHLAYGFASAFSGCYGLAAAEGELALTPPNERSPEARLPTDPIFERCDVALFARVLAAARAEPVRRFPHFGPIIPT